MPCKKTAIGVEKSLLQKRVDQAINPRTVCPKKIIASNRDWCNALHCFAKKLEAAFLCVPDTDGDTIRKTVWDMTVFEHGYEIEAQNQLDLPSVPSLSVQQSAKIVYDFVNNYTAILDQEEKVCYLLEMDQNVTKRPGDPDRDTFCKCNTEWIGYCKLQPL